MKNRTEGEMMLARRRALQRMHTVGITPKRQVLDNETSMEYRQEIIATGMTYQLVPPDEHRRNIAEKTIQTWKDHFISVCRGVYAHFPMHLWCRLTPQPEKQLLLLRQTNINPKISAFAYLYGTHIYNAQPFSPIGMEAMIHNKTSQRKTFAQHCSKGFVLGSSPEHYQCWNLWTTSTKATRVSGTVFFKHNYITNPETTPTDAMIAAANRMTETLRNQTPINMCEEDLEPLRRLETIFTRAVTNTNIQIKATLIQTPPRVLTTTLTELWS